MLNVTIHWGNISSFKVCFQAKRRMAPGVMLYKSHAFRKQIFTVTLSRVLRDGMTYLHPTNTGIKTVFRVKTHISDLKAAAIHCKLRMRVYVCVCTRMSPHEKWIKDGILNVLTNCHDLCHNLTVWWSSVIRARTDGLSLMSGGGSMATNLACLLKGYGFNFKQEWFRNWKVTMLKISPYHLRALGQGT